MIARFHLKYHIKMSLTRTYKHAKLFIVIHFNIWATVLSVSQTSIREPSANILKTKGETHINMSIPYLG